MIKIKLTSYNTGQHFTAKDFDYWVTFVFNHIENDTKIEIYEIDQFDFANGPDKDLITGATEDQLFILKNWLQYDGWEKFCSGEGYEK